jgi:hypothetical protein
MKMRVNPVHLTMIFLEINAPNFVPAIAYQTILVYLLRTSCSGKVKRDSVRLSVGAFNSINFSKFYKIEENFIWQIMNKVLPRY